MSRRRFSLQYRAEFYANKQESQWQIGALPTPFGATQKGWEDGYRASQRDQAKARKKAKTS